MKKQLAIIAAIAMAAGFSAFGQGYVEFATGTHTLYDEFTIPGGGGTPLYPASSAVDVTFLWAASGTADQLQTVGSALSAKAGGTTVGEVATNGVTSIASPTATIQAMLSGGWQVASNSAGGLEISTVANTTGSISAGQFQLAGTTAGNSYEIVVIAWNASASSFLTAADIGWSNPFNYATGTSTSDPVGQTPMSTETAGLNQFGIAAVPEPATLALAGLGGLSALFLRRRKA